MTDRTKRASEGTPCRITTVTLNPAIDQALAIERFVLGGINRCDLDAIDPGGKGINASRVIHRLGRPTLALGFVGGVTGRMLVERLAAEGVPYSFDEVPQMTRVNVMLYERHNHRRTRIYQPGSRVEPADLAGLRARFAELEAGSLVILAGSLPPGLPATTYRDLIVELRERGLGVLLDTSGPALAAAIEAGPLLIKPNAEELAELVGHPLRAEADLIASAQELRQRGVANVVISLGGQGAIGIGPDGAWRVHAPYVVAVSTIGSGDSMVAGLAIALNEGLGLADGLRLGSAAGTATAMTHGTQLCRPADVERLVPEIIVRPIPPSGHLLH
jgi:1-phosphofructokinase family hexose kinase